MQTKEEKQKISWDLGDGRVVQILYNNATEFDVDDVVKIDINNLMGEYLTAPQIFNTIANLRANAMEIVSKAKLNLEIGQKGIFLGIIEEFKGKKKPSNPEIEAMVCVDDDYIQLKKDLIKAEKNANMLDNLYWSVKEKCNKLDNLYHKISPEEFNKEIMEGQINNVIIKIKKSVI